MTGITPLGGGDAGAGDFGLLAFAPGISLPFADGRYVRRQVEGVLTADTYMGANNSGPERQFSVPAPAAAVIGMPTDTDPSLFEPGDGMRADIRLKVFRGNNNPEIGLVRFNGSYAAPTGALSGDVLGSLRFRAYAAGGGFAPYRC